MISPHDTYGSLRRLADRLGVDVHSEVIPDKGLCGYYEAWRNAIVIDRTMTYRQKRCTLVHELVHWSYGDFFHRSVIDSRLETRARRETASLLVDRSEYAQAEIEYDGEPRSIAIELDVTLQIIEDYRDMVLAPMRDQCAAL
jgi:Zn-dependent peptidase ImmA (M78 family)